MFHIIQSNDTDVLVEQLLTFYQAKADCADIAEQIFSTFTVITPSKVLGDWLSKAIATKAGISTLFTSQFWGQYQWRLIDDVLSVESGQKDALAVPEVAVLSAAVMRWRLLGFFGVMTDKEYRLILEDESHVLHRFLGLLYDEATDSVPESRLWQACDELARLYVRYLTQRPEWLLAWANDTALPVSVEDMIAQKDRFSTDFGGVERTPEWLELHYVQLERLLRFLWQTLFGNTYQYRQLLEERFWDILEQKRGDDSHKQAMSTLPKQLYLFTVQQIPPVELIFLKRLSLHTDVYLFHFNPSKMFWADIVDKNWLMTQQIIRPESVYLKDYAHGLLSSLGKESRETFAMLADMSGGAYYYESGAYEPADKQPQPFVQNWQVQWQDAFVTKSTGVHDSLLSQLKQDILMLEEGGTSSVMTRQMFDGLSQKSRQKSPLSLDINLENTDNARLPSLSIHACHSLKRQLELARIIIARYLNEPTDGTTRKLSDVVVLLPDVSSAQDLIGAVFCEGKGADGLYLPAKITGATDRAIDDLMSAIAGFYRLLGAKNARFQIDEFAEWLMMPALHESFGLDFDAAYRACDLLKQAGFRRGFDAIHLSDTLDGQDLDYRYTFSYALDRIVLGFLTPDSGVSDVLYPFDWHTDVLAEQCLPLAGITLEDLPIVSALTEIHQALSRHRHDASRIDRVQTWLNRIEAEVINRYFYRLKDTPELRAIFEAKNQMMASLRANAKHFQPQTQSFTDVAMPTQTADDIQLSLEFVLENLSESVGMQAVRAEPSGVITFARFGALRSIPFGLVIMLDMNLSSFPRQDKNVRLDLMRAGLKRRGDRYHEDDDNGAFLDAILCAKDACCIFYQGIAADGKTRLLPASAVGELIEFLKNEGEWHVPTTHDTDIKTIKNLMPALVERYLITDHTASGFDLALFYEPCTPDDTSDATLEQMLIKLIDDSKKVWQRHLPPPPIWQQVRATIDDEANSVPAMGVVSLPTKDDVMNICQALQSNASGLVSQVDTLLDTYEITPPVSLRLQDVWQAFKSFAKTYLRGKLQVYQSDGEIDVSEPLSLDNLDNWRLNDMLTKAVSLGCFDGALEHKFTAKSLWQSPKLPNELSSLYFGNLLPAGEMRTAKLDDALADLGSRLSVFSQQVHNLEASSIRQQCQAKLATDYAWLITPTDDQQVAIPIGSSRVLMSGNVPATDDVWLSMISSSMRDDHKMGFWLSHLYWQVVRQTDKADIDAMRGLSVRQFRENEVMILPPIHHHQAMQYLQNAIIIAKIAEKVPLILTNQTGLIIAKHSQDESFCYSDKLFSAWLKPESQQLPYETCSQHPIWQAILGHHNPLAAIQPMECLAVLLYQPLVRQLEG
ncbi:exodeoxyribonuclease V subunit gamma [Moraxella nasovis]|uniref:exodeoxyribonuclease V subunit gamma n=1 Tax=Moraxella nasovis TaxID=2904121 RepID=UPI001F613268|nr:exodeoxyribonuclease V subunit gamma [Moraxella nasovis]UNU73249.1 exodeoxyribonuclease V subunit gamma [Moraxella nasovis]